MDFTANKLPSVAKEIEWYWGKRISSVMKKQWETV